ncbi:hypothetical protein DFJ73DRAFT_847457, partial [Zopfochytrium polystomum]
MAVQYVLVPVVTVTWHWVPVFPVHIAHKFLEDSSCNMNVTCKAVQTLPPTRPFKLFKIISQEFPINWLQTIDIEVSTLSSNRLAVECIGSVTPSAAKVTTRAQTHGLEFSEIIKALHEDPTIPADAIRNLEKDRELLTAPLPSHLRTEIDRCFEYLEHVDNPSEWADAGGWMRSTATREVMQALLLNRLEAFPKQQLRASHVAAYLKKLVEKLPGAHVPDSVKRIACILFECCEESQASEELYSKSHSASLVMSMLHISPERWYILDRLRCLLHHIIRTSTTTSTARPSLWLSQPSITSVAATCKRRSCGSSADWKLKQERRRTPQLRGLWREKERETNGGRNGGCGQTLLQSGEARRVEFKGQPQRLTTRPVPLMLLLYSTLLMPRRRSCRV